MSYSSQFSLYGFLSDLPYLNRSYPLKIMVVAFLGIQAPLMAVIFYVFAIAQVEAHLQLEILGLMLTATLIGTSFTLLALFHLLRPVMVTASALRLYVAHSLKPSLPTSYEDEIGRLMASVQTAIDQLHSTINTLDTLAHVDGLTQVYNRQAGRRRLSEDAGRIQRNGGSFYVGVIDLDRFKQLNDTYGHQFGDRCLCHLATLIRQTIRQGDWVARWGGDEFVIGLWQPNSRCVRHVFNRLLQRIESTPLTAPDGQRITLELSIGVCRYSEALGEEGTLQSADQAMYWAKRQADQPLKIMPPVEALSVSVSVG